MTDEKNNPHFQSNLSPFPGLSQLRQQAEQKAKAIALPDLDSIRYHGNRCTSLCRSHGSGNKK
ncbi:MAG: hypothetical protein R6V39_03475, partial [Desulfovibrionales bacterium]